MLFLFSIVFRLKNFVRKDTLDSEPPFKRQRDCMKADNCSVAFFQLPSCAWFVWVSSWKQTGKTNETQFDCHGCLVVDSKFGIRHFREAIGELVR